MLSTENSAACLPYDAPKNAKEAWEGGPGHRGVHIATVSEQRKEGEPEDDCVINSGELTYTQVRRNQERKKLKCK